MECVTAVSNYHHLHPPSRTLRNAMQTLNGMASLECGTLCYINKDLRVGLYEQLTCD